MHGCVIWQLIFFSKLLTTWIPTNSRTKMPSGVRRRKHNRSSLSKNTRRVKDKQKKVTVKGNAIIAANWDEKLTLAQNYKKLGLRAKLQTPAGGEEKDITLGSQLEKEVEKPEIAPLAPTEGRIVRHADGTTTVEYGKNRSYDSSDDEDDEEEWTGFGETDVVRQLEEMAKHEIKKPRVQSEREQDWVAQIYNKHGDDYEAMFRDRKLNIYQQSIGDLRRRVNKWKKANGITV